MPFLDEILKCKEAEIAVSKTRFSISDLRRMAQDAPPIRSFYGSLLRSFGLIAEIKRKSPSVGPMRVENVNNAADAYSASPIVNAISVLTDSGYFGMELNDLLKIKEKVPYPILRKDFIIDRYQIYEARAYGADAVLLMANVINRHKLKYIYETVRELEMDALFEVHTKDEIDLIPKDALIWGINSRRFMADKRWKVARVLASSKFLNRFWRISKSADPINSNVFSLIKHLPKDAVKVAESGIDPRKIKQIQAYGFNAALVGTSLLKDPRGISEPLKEFETSISHIESSQLDHTVAAAA
jgi:indole-3-glycerol phosphate synthase